MIAERYGQELPSATSWQNLDSTAFSYHMDKRHMAFLVELLAAAGPSLQSSFTIFSRCWLFYKNKQLINDDDYG